MLLLLLVVVFSAALTYTARKSLHLRTADTQNESVDEQLPADILALVLFFASVWRLLYGGTTIFPPAHDNGAFPVVVSGFDILFSYETTVVLCVGLVVHRYRDGLTARKKYLGDSLMTASVLQCLLSLYIAFTYVVYQWSGEWDRHWRPGCDRRSVRTYELVANLLLISSWGEFTVLQLMNPSTDWWRQSNESPDRRWTSSRYWNWFVSTAVRETRLSQNKTRSILGIKAANDLKEQ